MYMINTSFHMVAKVSRVKVYLDDTCDTFATIWKLGFKKYYKFVLYFLFSVDANFDKHDIPYDVLWLDIEHTNGKRSVSH